MTKAYECMMTGCDQSFDTPQEACDCHGSGCYVKFVCECGREYFDKEEAEACCSVPDKRDEGCFRYHND